MHTWLIALAALLAGAAIGLALGGRPAAGRADSPAPAAPDAPDASAPDPVDAQLAGPAAELVASGLSPQLSELLVELPGNALVVRNDGRVLWQSDSALRMRLTRRQTLVFEEMLGDLRLATAAGHPVQSEMELLRPPLRKGRLDVRLRAIPLSTDTALLLVEDLTEENRVADVRRDFIANVSHELKTPVGAMSLLSEAIVAAADSPESVARFAGRMQVEANRLANLINDVIDLSRLQGEDPLATAEPVPVGDLIDSAVDFISSTADAKSIEVVVGESHGAEVFGMADQLGTALRNLLTNAVAYSPPHTRVAVGVRVHDGVVNIAVKDQGIGVPQSEQQRIFERFYRVDAARSRVTGGTGLGLAIVRNVCRTHDGEVTVWSAGGQGATFTMHLPQYLDESGPRRSGS